MKMTKTMGLTILPVLLVYSFMATNYLSESVTKLNAQKEIKYPSGDAELDQIRLEISESPTTVDNFKLRAFKMKLWVVSLQQQGARLDSYLPIDERMRNIVWWNNIEHHMKDGSPQPFTDDQIRKLCKIVDDGYAILEKVQENLIENPQSLEFMSSEEAIHSSEEPETPWTHYKGNENLSGFTGAKGPTRGEKAWKFPIGLAWESKPAIEGDKVYLSSPGMRTIMYCLDLETGEKIWNTKQIVEIMGDQLYNTPNNQSSPLILKDYVLFRELGARGNKGPTRHIVFVNKQTGEISKEIVAGHVDYRAGHAPFDANEKYIVFTHGKQDIHEKPAVSQGFNRLICKDTNTDKVYWDYNVGFTFAEPLLDENRVFIGTQTGYMYAFMADGWYGFRSTAKWQFRAGGGINRKAEVYGDYLLFGANDGVFYCLNKYTGKLVWKYQVKDVETRSFRHFSHPYAADDKVVVGGSDKNFYCFDVRSGKLLFSYQADDWIRSQPVFQDNDYYFATMKGTFYGIRVKNGESKIIFKKKLSDYPIVANLAMKGDKIVINDANLYTHCLNTKGKFIWGNSLIESFEKGSVRIYNEQIAGGGYYQSKPTAVDGMVFFGTPIRFVYAVDAETGEEIWKFEMGAAISAAPTYDNDRIYVGQQGGEEEFYCLNAKTGEMIWNQKTGWVWGSANVSDGMVFVPGIDGYVMGLDAETGAIIWRHRFAMSVCSEPAVEGELVIFGSWDNYLIAFDKKTGRVVWQFQGGGTDSGVAIMKHGKIYFKNKCVDAKTGKLIWAYKEPGSEFNITPAYHNGKVYMSCWHGLGLGGICVEAVIYCLDANTGEKIWTHLGGGLSSPVIGDEGNVYFPSVADPYFYCVDANGNGDGTTTTKWIYKMGNKVEESTPALYKGKAYIMSSDGYIHAIK